MVGKQPGGGSGERRTRLPDFLPTRPQRIGKSSPAPATSAGTSNPGARHNGDAPAARAAASDSSSVLTGNEHFSIAHCSHPAQLLLAGELDICSVPGLTAALSDAADSTDVLHLDLADVHFCDLAALQAIISLTQASDRQQRPARPVVLHHLPAQAEKILRITGWDTLPGLTIDTGGSPPGSALIGSQVREGEWQRWPGP
jgi:anti-anti-sigma regulatory factor